MINGNYHLIIKLINCYRWKIIYISFNIYKNILYRNIFDLNNNIIQKFTRSTDDSQSYKLMSQNNVLCFSIGLTA